MANIYDIILNLIDRNQVDGIENRICKINFDIPVCDINVTNNFFYISFNNDKITEDQFVDILDDMLIFYCIPRTIISKALENFNKTQKLKYLTDLKEDAKSLFIKSHKKYGAQLGEPGELILYVIMEYFLDAPQIVSKMYYKQNTKLPVFGSDGLHIGYDKQNNNLIVYFCESKMYQDVGDSLTKIKESIENLVSIQDGTCQKQRDLKIINDFMEVKDEQEKQLLLSYLDPYSPNSNNVKEIFSCMTIFNSKIYKRMVGKTKDEIKQLFKDEYKDLAEDIVNKFVATIKESNIKNLEFNFIVLPVDDVDNIRSKFFAKLGIEEQND